MKLVGLEGDQALLGELSDGVGGALAGVAGLLDPAVGHLVGAEGGHLVDEDAAELEPVAGLEGEAGVAGEDPGLEAEAGVVGELDRLVEGGEAVDGGNRAEDLVAPDP